MTLADVVVVTAAGALIVPLLLAILRDANQQAGVAKCLSNLRVTMRATSMYLEDYGNDFPFFITNTQGQMTTSGVCTCPTAARRARTTGSRSMRVDSLAAWPSSGRSTRTCWAAMLSRM
jgi:hypothetical protein